MKIGYTNDNRVFMLIDGENKDGKAMQTTSIMSPGEAVDLAVKLQDAAYKAAERERGVILMPGG